MMHQSVNERRCQRDVLDNRRPLRQALSQGQCTAAPHPRGAGRGGGRDHDRLAAVPLAGVEPVRGRMAGDEAGGGSEPGVRGRGRAGPPRGRVVGRAERRRELAYVRLAIVQVPLAAYLCLKLVPALRPYRVRNLCGSITRRLVGLFQCAMQRFPLTAIGHNPDKDRIEERHSVRETGADIANSAKSCWLFRKCRIWWRSCRIDV